MHSEQTTSCDMHSSNQRTIGIPLIVTEQQQPSLEEEKTKVLQTTFGPNRTECEATNHNNIQTDHLITDSLSMMMTMLDLFPFFDQTSETRSTTTTESTITSSTSSSSMSNKSKDIVVLEQSQQSQLQQQQLLLFQRLVGDVLVGIGVTATIAPSLTVIDKAMVQYSANTHSFSRSVQESIYNMIRHPWQYLKSPTFLCMWATYAATYSIANVLKTVADYNNNNTNTIISNDESHQQRRRRRQEEQQQDSKLLRTKEDNQQNLSSRNNNNNNNQDLSSFWSMVVFVGTTAANSSASLCKDRVYARLFGTSTVTTTIPPICYGLWLARDFTVIGSSFLLPPLVAQYMVQQHGWNHNNNNNNNNSNSQPTMLDKTPNTQTLALAQFVTPVAAQLIAGPLHYLGLDYSNRPNSTIPWIERWRHLKGGLSSIIPARMIRILPGYGLGGVWNQHGRKAWHDFVNENNNNNKNNKKPMSNTVMPAYHMWKQQRQLTTTTTLTNNHYD